MRVCPLDTSAVCANSVLQYAAIAPGQSSYGSSVQMIGFSKWCTGARDIPLELIISNRGMEFWCDTFSVRVTDPLGVPEKGEIPTAFALKQNYPNPFNPGTTIIYDLPRSSNVTLAVFDLLGREVSVVVNEVVNAGYHEVSFDASSLASGVYMYRLHAGDFVSTKKMLILR